MILITYHELLSIYHSKYTSTNYALLALECQGPKEEKQKW